MASLSATSVRVPQNALSGKCKMVFGLPAALVWTTMLVLLITTSLLVASDYPQRNTTPVYDIWIPVDLLNRTFVNLTTKAASVDAVSKKKTFVKPRESSPKKKKKPSSSMSSTPLTTSATASEDAPNGEPVFSPKTKASTPSLIDNQKALFSVDSWMGNLAELPQDRVKELQALAAASMRNHQKVHPLQTAASMPKRTAAFRGDLGGAGGTNDHKKKDSVSGESIITEHRLHPPDDESAEFPHEDDVGRSLHDNNPPTCASFHKLYCDVSDDYPAVLINQVTKYLAWPLEKLFRELRELHPPTLAHSESGNLVCDSVTKIIRPGWARNTNGKWLLVINTPHHIQTVTEIQCRSEGSTCRYIAPCFYSSCQQRYNIQSLLVIDPSNHYKGPFLSQFLFPSSCVCFVPDPKLLLQAQCQATAKYGL